MSYALPDTDTDTDTPADVAVDAAEKATDAAAGAGYTDELTDHDYDGIEEYDNPLPGWWKWLFVASIVFSGFYMIVSLLAGSQWGSRPDHARAVDRQNAAMVASIGELTPTPDTLARVATDERLLSYGKGVFAANCASCHGSDAGGTITAPNLTDDAMIHVRAMIDFLDVVETGRKGGAMPAWRGRLSPNDVIIVAGYTASLRGTHAPGGRPPEGEVVGEL